MTLNETRKAIANLQSEINALIAEQDTITAKIASNERDNAPIDSLVATHTKNAFLLDAKRARLDALVEEREQLEDKERVKELLSLLRAYNASVKAHDTALDALASATLDYANLVADYLQSERAMIDAQNTLTTQQWQAQRAGIIAPDAVIGSEQGIEMQSHANAPRAVKMIAGLSIWQSLATGHSVLDR